MTDSSCHLPDQNPETIAKRLLQKAHNRDGLPEIATGIIFLVLASLSWMRVVLQPGTVGYKASIWIGILLIPLLIIGPNWVIKIVRRNFLIDKVGYVELKPTNQMRTWRVGVIALVVAFVAAFAVRKAPFLLPPVNWTPAATGILGGALAAFVGRSPRFFVVGAVMATTGTLVAFQGFSPDMGFAILWAVMGIFCLISGSISFLILLREPTEAAE